MNYLRVPYAYYRKLKEEVLENITFYNELN